jgi:hypothetical protein
LRASVGAVRGLALSRVSRVRKRGESKGQTARQIAQGVDIFVLEGRRLAA